MPSKPKRPCGQPGCPELTDKGYCDKHRKERDRRRGTAASRGYGHKWKVARDQYLKEHPLCVECLKVGKVEAARAVDHIIAHKGDPVLFWNRSNWQSLCIPCHSLKTVQKDGGFGREARG
ncbi:HNH endonuclease [Paenibacillus stellifer]|uniref:Putative HNH nuclease YajD n=1 Tax=Paenibacillus stellifer TaxID=169760 RepID=A0A089LP28_9BACL|nr:HNH endonuclease [Paenibacillus stellifer]AIQ63306.1 HNH endonuclease [Paenibacillus stellifer]